MHDGSASSSSSDERSAPPSLLFAPLPKLSQLLERHVSISTPTTASAYAAQSFPVSAAPAATGNDRKRSLDELQCDRDDDEDDEDDAPLASARALNANGDGSKPRRAGKWRKPTYLIRKVRVLCDVELWIGSVLT